MTVRAAAVAGTWYPGTRGALTREVDDYVNAAADPPPLDVRAVIAPHAGIMFSGPVAAHAYKAAASCRYDVIALVGPSHFVAFDGVVVFPSGAFETPFGPDPDRRALGAGAEQGVSRAARDRSTCARTFAGDAAPVSCAAPA